LTTTFGDLDMGKKDDETNLYVEHACSSSQNLELALGFVKAREAIRDSVVKTFVQALATRLAKELGAGKDGWLVQSVAGGPRLDQGMWIAVSHKDWPADPKTKEPLRVVLDSDDGRWAYHVYLSIRRASLTSSKAKPDTLAAQLLAAAHSACGKGYPSDSW